MEPFFDIKVKKMRSVLKMFGAEAERELCIVSETMRVTRQFPNLVFKPLVVADSASSFYDTKINKKVFNG